SWWRRSWRLLVKFSLDGLDHGEVDGNGGAPSPCHARGFPLQAGRADVVNALSQPAAHGWRKIVVGAHPNMPLVERQTFHLPRFEVCPLRQLRRPIGTDLRHY